MNSQDFRNLQESYLDVYEQEVDEAKVDFTAGRGPFANDEYPGEGSPQDKGVKSANRKIDSARTKAGHTAKFGPRAKAAAQGRRQLGVLNTVTKRERSKNEEYDLYDLILSHLLDEGYADTQEAAESIMVNMSEDWRESIVETRMDPRGRPASGPMNVYANPKGKPSQARLDAIAAVEADNKKKTPEQRKKELDDYRERQMNNK